MWLIFFNLSSFYTYFLFPLDTPPVTSQISAEPLKPLPPALTSSQIQVENVSPAPVPTQQQQKPVIVTTEPPKVTQTVDTSFVSAQTGKQTSEKPTVASANVLQPSLTSYSVVTSSYSADKNYVMSIYPQTVQPTGVTTLTTNASFQPSLGSTTLGSVPPFHLPTQFQNQSYLPPTQGYGHFTSLGGFPNAPPPPLPPMPTSTLYPPPPSGVNTLQNPTGYGVPPHQGRPPHPPMSLPPPPLPPLHGGQLPPLPQVSSTDFQWPRQFGVPPTQNQQMGGWMR